MGKTTNLLIGLGIFGGVAVGLYFLFKKFSPDVGRSVSEGLSDLGSTILGGGGGGAPSPSAAIDLTPSGTGGTPYQQQVRQILGAQQQYEDVQDAALLQHEAEIAALQSALAGKETFPEGAPNIYKFKLKKPIIAPETGIQVEYFNVRTDKPKNLTERRSRIQAAKTAAKAVGFNLSTELFGREATPIHTLIDTPERIEKFHDQLEASQLRRLGLRKIKLPSEITATGRSLSSSPVKYVSTTINIPAATTRLTTSYNAPHTNKKMFVQAQKQSAIKAKKVKYYHGGLAFG